MAWKDSKIYGLALWRTACDRLRIHQEIKDRRECEEQGRSVELRYEGVVAITGNLFLEFPRLVHIRESTDANAEWGLAGNLIDKDAVVLFRKQRDQEVGLRGTLKRTHLNRITRALHWHWRRGGRLCRCSGRGRHRWKLERRWRATGNRYWSGSIRFGIQQRPNNAR